MIIANKKVELFCGTGGVGKTTIATARALSLALNGKKVLLITIDPAKRLKQILNLSDNDEGSISIVHGDLFELDKNIEFHAMLMSPRATLQKIAKEHGLEEEFKTSIISTLSRPYSGMNEIMSIIEVQYQLEKNHYDTIVLDTPPGKHFIDFLESSEKINNFFDKSFLEIFEYLGKNLSNQQKKSSLFNKIVSSGVNKLLSYLEKVTGQDFVKEFIDSVLVLYKSRDAFLKALKFQNDLKKRDFSNWFLVTSIDQQKTNEANDLKNLASSFLHQDNYLVINKCLLNQIDAWVPTNPSLELLKESLLNKEKRVETYSEANFENIIKFDEVLASKPTDHVKKIAINFNQYNGNNHDF
jgi:anion-transporting  ArsA/GET3 family ATPase